MTLRTFLKKITPPYPIIRPKTGAFAKIDTIEGKQTPPLQPGKCQCHRFGNCGAPAETDGYCDYCYTGKCGGAR